MSAFGDVEVVHLLIRRLGRSHVLEAEGKRAEALSQLELAAAELEINGSGLAVAELLVNYLLDVQANRRRQQLKYRILTRLGRVDEADALSQNFLAWSEAEQAQNDKAWTIGNDKDSS